MKHTEPPPISPPKVRDWVSNALAIVTVATVIAGVIVGSYVAIIEGQGNFASLADRNYWAFAIFVTGTATLLTYFGVVVFGMATGSIQKTTYVIQTSSEPQCSFISKQSVSSLSQFC